MEKSNLVERGIGSLGTCKGGKMKPTMKLSIKNFAREKKHDQKDRKPWIPKKTTLQSTLKSTLGAKGGRGDEKNLQGVKNEVYTTKLEVLERGFG